MFSKEDSGKPEKEETTRVVFKQQRLVDGTSVTRTFELR